MTRVTLLSDFGTADGYVAAMAGVIAAAAPAARTEHAAHDLAQGDIFGAALTLSRYAFLYPAGTVHLIVVDPGVGTGRRAIAARARDRFFVAPDNGVLTLVLREDPGARIVALDPTGVAVTETGVSSTFHGRDLFAPAAGRLARGEPLSDLGAAVADPVRLTLPRPVPEGEGVRGEVLHADHFGNLISNIPGDGLTRESRVVVEGVGVGPVRRTYADVAPGALVALVGSLGLLEVSVRNGSAADRLGAGRGAAVSCSPAQLSSQSRSALDRRR